MHARSLLLSPQSLGPDMHTYIPSTIADCPHAIEDEELYTQEILHDILNRKHQAPNADDDDIIMTLFDREIDLYSLDHDAQYFDDDDLYYAAQTDEAYDYPRGVDDDDEDSYTRDPDLRAIFEQGMLHNREKWEPFEFHSFVEEGLSNAQYFDAVELYERPEFPASAAYYEDTDRDSDTSGESDGDQGPHAITPRPSSQDTWQASFRHFSGGIILAGSTSTMTLVPEREEGETVSRHFSRTNNVF
jgi:hypothetical protein